MKHEEGKDMGDDSTRMGLGREGNLVFGGMKFEIE